MVDIDQIVGIVKGFELFSDLDEDVLRSMFETSSYRIASYHKDHMIHMQNEICRTMDIIFQGEVVVQKIDEHGHVLTIGVFTAGDIVGANLIFASKNFYPMTVVTHSDVQLLHLSKDAIITLGQDSRVFLNYLLTAISDRTLVLTDKINTISLKTIRQRIIDFLRYEYHVQQDAVIKLKMPKKELAERLGIPRSSLGRELHKMQQDGLIVYDAKSITIQDNLFIE